MSDPKEPKITIPEDAPKPEGKSAPKVSLENNSSQPTISLESSAQPKLSIPANVQPAPSTTLKANTISLEDDERTIKSKMAEVDEHTSDFSKLAEAFFRKLVNGIQLALAGIAVAIGKLLPGKLGGALVNIGAHLARSTPIVHETENRFVVQTSPKENQKNSAMSKPQTFQQNALSKTEEREISLTHAFDATKETVAKGNEKQVQPVSNHVEAEKDQLPSNPKHKR